MNQVEKSWALSKRHILYLLGTLLAVGTMVAYWPVTNCGFVNYDDPLCISANPEVRAGLTLKGMGWAFTTGETCNWHPLTWLSLMLDASVFGKHAFGFHLTNLVLHMINTVLLFGLLWYLTTAKWRSLMVAALFAWHPLHVESVAWVSERKDVLCACFGFLALLFYVRYARFKEEARVQSPKPKVSIFGRKFYYGLSLLTFVLGLMSKPMLVTWPFVMLLLDYWPLDRASLLQPLAFSFKPFQVWWPLVREKTPFFVLAAAASAVTFLVQKDGGAVVAVKNLPLGMRVGNAVISYCRYLGKVFWPMDLAVFYPHPAAWSAEEIGLAVVFLAGVTALLIWLRQGHPWLLMGWLWYCGTLVPVIGLVQVGEQAMADRYTYIPLVGIFIMLVWGGFELMRCARGAEAVLAVGGVATLILCVALMRQQIGYWRNSETLYGHALQVTTGNFIAHNNLGVGLNDEDRTDEAISQFQQALLAKPDYAEAQNNLGIALDKQGHTAEAISHYRQALGLRSNFPDAHNNLGAALNRQGQGEAAIREIWEALRLKPEYGAAHYNLGDALSKRGRTNEAVTQYEQALRLQPDWAEGHNGFGHFLANQGQSERAISEYQQATRLKPEYVEAHNNLGLALVQEGQMAEAVEQFQQAIKVEPDYAEAYNNLGYLWVESGEHLDEARAMIAKAIQLEPKNNNFLDSMGCCLLKQNDAAEGLDYELKAIAYSRQPDASLYEHLGDTYAALRQRDKAAEAWRKSLAVAPNPQVQKKLDGLTAR